MRICNQTKYSPILRGRYSIKWKPTVVMMRTLSLAERRVVIMTSRDATSDDKIGHVSGGWCSQRHTSWIVSLFALLWCHNGCDSVSNHQPHDCLLNRLFGRWSKKTSKLRVTGLCARNSPETGEFPAQMTSNAENVSIWWRHHGLIHISTCHEMVTI